MTIKISDKIDLKIKKETATMGKILLSHKNK